MKKILCVILSMIFMFSGLTIAAYAEDAECAHDYQITVVAPTCVERGYTLHTCGQCGNFYKDAYTDAYGHSYGEWTVIDVATCTSEGLAERKCSRCTAFETKTTPVLEHKDKNNDGKCDACGFEIPVEDVFSPFDWLIALFRAIAEWFRAIFA